MPTPKKSTKPSRFLRRLLIGKVIGITGMLGYISEDLVQGDQIPEVRLETDREEALEDEYDIPFSFGNEVGGPLRDWRVSQLETVLQRARQWDYFDQQLALVDTILVRGYDGSAVGRASPQQKMVMYCMSDEWCADDRVFIHELGHIWSYGLRTGFWMLWEGISGSGYHRQNELAEKELGSRCQEYMDAVAAVSCHGAKNKWEDVAEVFQFVYDINYTTPVPYGYRFPLANISRIERKVRLLHRYDAFSIEERNVALGWLKEYRLQQEATREPTVIASPLREVTIIPSTTNISLTHITCVGDAPCIKQTFARPFP